MAFENILRPSGRPTSTSMFGGSSGKQGTFDPDDEGQTSQALARLMELQSEYGDRLEPNHTGSTGLASNDLGGYANMKNAVVESQNIQRIMNGGQPLQVKFNPRGAQSETSPTQQGQFKDTSQLHGSYLQPLQGLSNAAPRPETHQNFMKRYGRG